MPIKLGHKFKDDVPLNAAQLRTLLATRARDRCNAFPNHTQRFLNEEYTRAKALFPPEQQAEIRVSELREKAKLREADRLYKAAIAENARLRQQLDVVQSLPEVAPREVVIRASAKGSKREATAILQASDWHMEETTTLEKTNQLNEYDLKIAKLRADYFFRNSAKLVHKEAQNVSIKNVVLWLGGDFFTGSIHDDCIAVNALGPMDAVALVQDTLAGGVEYLTKELGKGVQLTVVCSVGNHSRTTKEQRIASEHENSLEWLAYGNLAREFRAHERVTFIRDRAYHTFVDVHGVVCRFHHGHWVRGGDNIGGVTIPLMKRIYKWNQIKHADHDFLGHFHTYNPTSAFTINGSLIGTTPYGLSVGGHEAPVQAFSLVDSKFGMTVRAPILLEAA